MNGTCEETRLLESAAAGNQAALGELLEMHRPRLRHTVGLRIDRRIRGRVDPSDVIQEAFVDAGKRLGEYVREPSVTFFNWLRFLALQRLMMAHRRHLGSQIRDARRELPIEVGNVNEDASTSLAAQLLGNRSSPSSAAGRAEVRASVIEALERLDTHDREVLFLRHFEQLTNRETADALGVSQPAASNRHVRALERLRRILLESHGGAPQL